MSSISMQGPLCNEYTLHDQIISPKFKICADNQNHSVNPSHLSPPASLFFLFQILPVTYTSIYIMSDEKNLSEGLQFISPLRALAGPNTSVSYLTFTFQSVIIASPPLTPRKVNTGLQNIGLSCIWQGPEGRYEYSVWYTFAASASFNSSLLFVLRTVPLKLLGASDVLKVSHFGLKWPPNAVRRCLVSGALTIYTDHSVLFVQAQIQSYCLMSSHPGVCLSVRFWKWHSSARAHFLRVFIQLQRLNTSAWKRSSEWKMCVLLVYC